MTRYDKNYNIISRYIQIRQYKIQKERAGWDPLPPIQNLSESPGTTRNIHWPRGAKQRQIIRPLRPSKCVWDILGPEVVFVGQIIKFSKQVWRQRQHAATLSRTIKAHLWAFSPRQSMYLLFDVHQLSSLACLTGMLMRSCEIPRICRCIDNVWQCVLVFTLHIDLYAQTKHDKTIKQLCFSRAAMPRRWERRPESHAAPVTAVTGGYGKSMGINMFSIVTNIPIFIFFWKL